MGLRLFVRLLTVGVLLVTALVVGALIKPVDAASRGSASGADFNGNGRDDFAIGAYRVNVGGKIAPGAAPYEDRSVKSGPRHRPLLGPDDIGFPSADPKDFGNARSHSGSHCGSPAVKSEAFFPR